MEIAQANLSAEDLILQIEEQSKFRFIYTNELLKGLPSLQLANKQHTVEELLALTETQVGVTYQQKRNLLILSKAQKKVKVVEPQLFVISGFIKEAESEETLIGATMLAISSSGERKGAVSNPYGFYSITLPEDTYQIIYSNIGFYADTFELDLTGNIRLNWFMQPFSKRLAEVTVIADQEMEANLEQVQMSTHRLDMKKIGKIPYLYGEVDVIRALGNLPGVSTVGQVSTGFNVRGGSVDQNLIFLDDAPVYYTSHFYGLVSVFNSDVVKDAKIYKGSIPARFGGSLSSVTEIWQREGSNEELVVSGGVGVISTRLSVEGPIKKDKSTFLISGRTAFSDLSNIGLRNTGLSNVGGDFNDLNLKLNYKLNSKNRLYLSGFYGFDESKLENGEDYQWGNINGSFRWNRVYNRSLFSNFTAVYSRYEYSALDFDGINDSELFSKLASYRLKDDFTWFKSSKHTFNFGGQLIFHEFSPGTFVKENVDLKKELALQREHGVEAALYFTDEWKFSEKLSVDYGLRYSGLFNLGPSEVYVYGPEGPVVGEPIDTLSLGKGELVKAYHGPEPRLAVRYRFSPEKGVKFSYNRHRQYIHLVSNSTNVYLTDVWKLSNTHIKPQISDQVSIGYFQNFKDKSIDASVEVYFKNMQNVLEYKDGAELVLNQRVEKDLLSNRGVAYGLEFMVNWNTDKFEGMLAYTLSRSQRKTLGEFEQEQINKGEFYPSNSDRLHDLKVLGTYHLNDKWSFSATFTYATGRPITLPDSRFVFEGKAIPNFSDRNQDRLPSHHRLDLTAVMRGRVIKKKGKNAGKLKRTQGYWVFSLYNVYARENTFSVNYSRDPNDPSKGQLEQFYIFKTIIPSVTYNFKHTGRK
ncbi:carboxypeptidase-like regulatory domain-containing protein [Flammeovirgaceae bacterium SG7u.111]|nr:carboxypeptidase-like regulatory domain-containing protein [Flammeovirgaceae bacterium SG7u.132]WPO37626.1 carboxypeptidase-like regulatory domain-containing protein [Flammeovirgaceae bacterium SG7u.111]